MKRLITQELIKWSQSKRRKPLIVEGARQTGKTHAITKEFGENYLQGKIHIVDFEKRPDWGAIFEKNLEVKRILSELELALNSRIDIENDLLFFDEVQNAPRALMSLRYFYENLPQLRVIAAGSLLEFALSEISFPVGRVSFLTLHPMNFIEFLYAQGRDLLAEKLLAGEFVFSEPIHSLLFEELKKYFFVGGMPEAVAEYIRSNKISAAIIVHQDLLSSFRNDFTKYGRRIEPRILDGVLLGTSKYVGQQTKYARLYEGASSPSIKNAFELLCQAKLTKKIPAVSNVGFPLTALASGKKFKSALLDIGLLQTLSGIPIDFEFRKENLHEIYNGILAEQFVAQELISQGKELFYWARDKRGSSAEIDFVTTHKNKIIPIEVKSGKVGRLKSLHLFLQTYPTIENGYVIQQTEYAELPEQKIKFIPLYAAYSFLLND